MWPFKRKKYVVFSPVFSGYYADPKYRLDEIWTADVNKAMKFNSRWEANGIAAGIAARGISATILEV